MDESEKSFYFTRSGWANAKLMFSLAQLLRKKISHFSF